MTTVTPAILTTTDEGKLSFRIGLLYDFAQKTWEHNGEAGSYAVTGGFDASKVYNSLGAAYAGLVHMKWQRHMELEGNVNFAFGLQLVYLAEHDFADIKSAAISWIEEVREDEDVLEHVLQPA